MAYMTHKDIAEELGCSVNTVKRIQRTALDKLRKRLEEEPELRQFIADLLEEEPDTSSQELIGLILEHEAWK